MWNNPDRLIAMIEEHLSRRPGMEARDIYKLLYQSVRGPEHMITSPTAFTEQLAAEWESLDLAGSDLLWEAVRTYGSLLRLNLRPFKSQGGDLEKLVTACLETARRLWGTQTELQQAWEGFTSTCRDRSWPGVAVNDVKSFTSWLETNSYPAVHHSERYRSLYRPTYRLVAAEIRFPLIF
jgi:hypothetical protein